MPRGINKNTCNEPSHLSLGVHVIDRKKSEESG